MTSIFRGWVPFHGGPFGGAAPLHALPGQVLLDGPPVVPGLRARSPRCSPRPAPLDDRDRVGGGSRRPFRRDPTLEFIHALAPRNRARVDRPGTGAWWQHDDAVASDPAGQVGTAGCAASGADTASHGAGPCPVGSRTGAGCCSRYRSGRIASYHRVVRGRVDL